MLSLNLSWPGSDCLGHCAHGLGYRGAAHSGALDDWVDNERKVSIIQCLMILSYIMTYDIKCYAHPPPRTAQNNTFTGIYNEKCPTIYIYIHSKHIFCTYTKPCIIRTRYGNIVSKDSNFFDRAIRWDILGLPTTHQDSALETVRCSKMPHFTHENELCRRFVGLHYQRFFKKKQRWKLLYQLRQPKIVPKFNSSNFACACCFLQIPGHEVEAEESPCNGQCRFDIMYGNPVESFSRSDQQKTCSNARIFWWVSITKTLQQLMSQKNKGDPNSISGT